MVYTIIDLVMLVIAIIFDLFILNTRLLRRKAFWVAYAILFPFQLITNWWLTHYNVVQYSTNAILGIRIASAPVEDIFFGFSLILLVLSIWVKQKK